MLAFYSNMTDDSSNCQPCVKGSQPHWHRQLGSQMRTISGYVLSGQAGSGPRSVAL